MSKINKLGKSTFVIAILSFILVAVLTFGGTYAYFSAKTGEVKGNIKMGTLTVKLTDGANTLTTLGDIAIAQPNQEILKETYTVDFTGSDIKAFVRVKVTAALEGITYTDNTQGDKDITAETIFTIEDGEGWFKHTDGYLYMGANAEAVATAVAAGQKQTLDLSIKVNKLVGEDGSTFFMGKTGTYSITVEAIQAEFLEGITEASKVSDIATAWGSIVSINN